ncbi:AMP-binding protein [Peterkaempfera sp. SMS 1(5)a]|uniref:AMP-binding protein n=1 Tax=Peterkaempfera podocarpi TaxID=3232308 RepID=UPI0036714D3F
MNEEEDRLAFPSDLQGQASSGGPALRALMAPIAQVSADVTTRCAKLGIGPDALLLTAYALTLTRWTGCRVLPVRCGGGTVTVEVDEDLNTDDLLCTVDTRLRTAASTSASASDSASDSDSDSGSGSGSADEAGPVQVGFGPDAVLGDGVELVLAADWRGEDWSGATSCLTGVWTAAELSGFTADLLAAVAELAAGSGPVEDIRCISAERRALLHRINQTDRDFPTAPLEELFHRIARRHPDAVAVREGDTELTYRRLAADVTVQARLLGEAGVGPGDTVLIGLPRSVAEIVAVLGTVQAGAAYVGVDLGAPPAHLAAIVDKCRPAAVLYGPGERTAPPEGVPAVPVWDASWNAPDAGAAATVVAAPRLPSIGAGGRPAYVAFTSGSTGKPKGVCVPHRGVVRLVHGADYARLGPGHACCGFRRWPSTRPRWNCGARC